MANILACGAGVYVIKSRSKPVCGESNRTVAYIVRPANGGTMTRDLVAMADWLGAEGVTNVAMESTGVFWKPIRVNSSFLSPVP
jgi:hypothetical protein